jgi:hypothetical protein
MHKPLFFNNLHSSFWQHVPDKMACIQAKEGEIAREVYLHSIPADAPGSGQKS